MNYGQKSTGKSEILGTLFDSEDTGSHKVKILYLF